MSIRVRRSVESNEKLELLRNFFPCPPPPAFFRLQNLEASSASAQLLP